ncbi:TolC family protein, partial [Desulfuromonas sp.]
RAYQDALDELAVLLNEPGPLETAEEPLGVPSLETDEDLGMLQALEKRPDLQRRARQIQRLSLERRIARNRALPRVDLLASYSHKGVGEDYSEDLDRLAEDEIRNWEVGLTLSYPLGNRDARQDYRRTELQLAGLRAGQEQLRREARSEVRTAIRLLDVSRTKIEVAHRAVELAEEKLRILLRRKEVGLATTRQVLEGEEDLAEARTDHTAALTEYNRAVTRYLQVTGLLLEREGIRLAGPADSEGAGPLLEMYRP